MQSFIFYLRIIVLMPTDIQKKSLTERVIEDLRQLGVNLSWLPAVSIKDLDLVAEVSSYCLPGERQHFFIRPGKDWISLHPQLTNPAALEKVTVEPYDIYLEPNETKTAYHLYLYSSATERALKIAVNAAQKIAKP